MCISLVVASTLLPPFNYLAMRDYFASVDKLEAQEEGCSDLTTVFMKRQLFTGFIKKFFSFCLH